MQKLAVLEAKTGLQKQLWQPNLQTFFKWFLALDNWGQSLSHTDKLFDNLKRVFKEFFSFS